MRKLSVIVPVGTIVLSGCLLGSTSADMNWTNAELKLMEYQLNELQISNGVLSDELKSSECDIHPDPDDDDDDLFKYKEQFPYEFGINKDGNPVVYQHIARWDEDDIDFPKFKRLFELYRDEWINELRAVGFDTSTEYVVFNAGQKSLEMLKKPGACNDCVNYIMEANPKDKRNTGSVFYLVDAPKSLQKKLENDAANFNDIYDRENLFKKLSYKPLAANRVSEVMPHY